MAAAASSFRHYSYALFLAVPITIGLIVSLLCQHARLWNWMQIVKMTLICMLWTALALLRCKIEGMVCILMAAVLVPGMVLLGLVISSFPSIQNPPQGWFADSLAYSIRCEIDGADEGATRRCVLSTGTMPEIFTRREKEKILEFEVMDTPPTMLSAIPSVMSIQLI